MGLLYNDILGQSLLRRSLVSRINTSVETIYSETTEVYSVWNATLEAVDGHKKDENMLPSSRSQHSMEKEDD